MFAEEEARVLVAAAATPDELAAMVERRAAGLPLEHVVGWADFCGLRLAVEAGVFVPRPRTELLVREAAALATDRAVAVDLCCGSGAVGAALFAAMPGLELHAVDTDAAAVRCARRNLEPAGGRVYRGDLCAPLPADLRAGIDVIVASPPYVPTESIAVMPREAREHEPRAALDGGDDGLDIVRRLSIEAPPWLASRGHLLIEMSESQAPTAAGALRRGGLGETRVVHSDELDATVVIGRRDDEGRH